MGVTTKHSLGAVQVDATTLGRITQVGVPTNTQAQSDSRSGEVFSRTQSIVAQNVTGNFTSEAIAQVIGQIPLIGVDIGALGAGVSFFATKHAKGGTRTGGATNRRYTFNAGLLHLGVLSVEHQANATITGIAVAGYDGTNEPVVPTENVALPTAPAEEIFSLGKITVGAIALTEFRSLEVNFGIASAAEGSESEVWPKFVNIADILPIITVTGIDIAWFAAASIPLTGKVALHADTIIYLRKRIKGGTFELDASLAHIKLTADGTVHVENAFDAQGNEAATATLVVTCGFDGSNDPIVMATGVAIP